MGKLKPKRTYKKQDSTERIYNGIGFIQKKLLKRYKKLEKEIGDDNSKENIERLKKLAGTIGYISQVHGGLAKTYDHEKRLAEIEERLELSKLEKHPKWGK